MYQYYSWSLCILVHFTTNLHALLSFEHLIKCGRSSELIVCLLHSGSSSLGSSPGWDHCFRHLAKTVLSQFHSAFLYPGIKMSQGFKTARLSTFYYSMLALINCFSTPFSKWALSFMSFKTFMSLIYESMDMQSKIISRWKVLHQDSFWCRSDSNSEMGIVFRWIWE